MDSHKYNGPFSEKEMQMLMFKNFLEDENLFQMFAEIYEQIPEVMPPASRFALEAILAWGGLDPHAK